MKKILLSLFGIITLGLINFSSAGTYTNSGSFSYSVTPTSSAYRKIIPLFFPVNSLPFINSGEYGPIISCVLTNNGGDIPSNIAISYSNLGYRNGGTFGYDDSSHSISSFGTVTSHYLNTSATDYLFGFSSISFKFPTNNITYNLNFDYSCTFDWSYIPNNSSDCSSVESQLSSCQSDLATATGNVASLTSSLATCQSDLNTCQNNTPECDDWTQLQCENEYDLIPESSITSEYCEDLFNLIDPENCPASGGTGDVMWSSFFVNSHQVQGASNIYLWLPDFLNWDYTYIDSGSTLEINVENQGDSDYIENMLAIQTYRPTSDEFALSFFGGLYLLFPYIFIVLLVLFIWRLIKRIFK